jgi:hypothetical protein
MAAVGAAPLPAPAAPAPRSREPWEARQVMRPMDPPGDDWNMDRWFVPR